MGHFVGDGDLLFFVSDDGKYWDSPEMVIEYDPKTYRVIGKRIVVQTPDIVVPAGTAMDYAGIRRARLAELYTDETGRIWDCEHKNAEMDKLTLMPKPALPPEIVMPVIPDSSTADTGPSTPDPVTKGPEISYKQRKTNRFKELNSLGWSVLKPMCPGSPKATKKAQLVGIIMEKEFGKDS